MALRVQAADDDDVLTHQTIDDAVGEVPQEESPCVPMHGWCSHRMSSDHLQAHLDRRQELLAKACALVLVPPIRPFDICGCCRPKDRRLHRWARICLRTSSQGTPGWPPSWMSRSSSSSRRSSSSRCSGVTGTAAGVRARLSHSRSRRSSRSSALSPSILIAASLTTLLSRQLPFGAMMANSEDHLRSSSLGLASSAATARSTSPTPTPELSIQERESGRSERSHEGTG